MKYIQKKKLVRMLLDNDIFNDINIQNLLNSEFIDKAKLNDTILKLIQLSEEQKNDHRTNKALNLMRNAFKVQNNKFNNNDILEITEKPYADFALKVRYPDVKKKKELHVFEHGSYNYNRITPSQSQRFFLYIKVNGDNKKSIIDKLKKSFHSLEFEEGKRMPSKEFVYNKLLEKYSEIE